jgi:hypothetical protein
MFLIRRFALKAPRRPVESDFQETVGFRLRGAVGRRGDAEGWGPRPILDVGGNNPDKSSGSNVELPHERLKRERGENGTADRNG